MAKKEMTIGDLARMVQRGFEGVNKKFEEVVKELRDFRSEVNEKLDRLEGDYRELLSIKEQITLFLFLAD